jgi:alpha-L-fucosidase
MRSLQEGDRGGTVWRPGETDVSIRPGWFHHPAQDEQVRSADDLVNIYFTSVGRNSKLLLNVPPTSEGLLHAIDAERLMGMRMELDRLFATDLARGGLSSWVGDRGMTGVGTLELAAPAVVSIADLREPIEQGQRVAAHRLEGRVNGAWRELTRGTTIGYRRLSRFEPVRVDAVRVTVTDAAEPPLPIVIGLYEG